jgi:hypothetical protein
MIRGCLYAVNFPDETQTLNQGNSEFPKREICVYIGLGGGTDEGPTRCNPGLAVNGLMVSLLRVCCHG